MKNGFGQRLEKAIKQRGFNNNSLSRIVNIHPTTIKNWIIEKTVPDNLKLDIVVNALDINKQWLTDELGEMDIENLEKSNPKPLANGKLIQKQHKKMVTIIPAKSQLGLRGTSFKEDFIGKLEQYEIYTEDYESGRYFEIECIGDSMDSGDPRNAILEGDEIRVREIPRENYINNQLHFHEWDEFTFFHYDRDIITKHVLDHDVEGRRVLLHSYNPDKESYPDEWIDLNDCYIVCNVIEVTRPRGYKKRLKKLNGTK